jgi:hypothetical protein
MSTRTPVQIITDTKFTLAGFGSASINARGTKGPSLPEPLGEKLSPWRRGGAGGGYGTQIVAWDA